MKHPLLLITLVVLGSLNAHAQPGRKDPFAANAPGDAPDPGLPPVISLCYEAFSLPLAMAAKFQRGNPSDSEIYGLITTSLEKDNVRQESFTILRTRSGQKATVESITEQIYPTEYEPPEMPQSLGVAITPPKEKPAPAPVKDPAKPQPPADKPVPEPEPEPVPDVDASKLQNAPDLSSLKTLAPPATPTAFDTRNTGATLEMEATLDQRLTLVDLRIVPEHIALVGRSIHGQGLSTVEMPTFESQRINTAVTVTLNQPSLLGTINRPPGSKLDPDSANRVWFAFVTVTLAKP